MRPKYEVSYSPLALQDLDEIWDYVEVELGKPSAARRAVEAIMERVSLLGDFPLSGTPLSSVCPMETEYRFVVAGNYLAFYRVSDGKVRVDRVLHSRRDYLRTLLPDTFLEDI